jgi:hypothetical protein
LKYPLKYPLIFLCIFLRLGAGFLGAQNNPSAEDQSIYVIRDLEFNVKGRTRPFAIIDKGEFRINEEIRGRAGLEKYVAGKEQILLNQRVLERASIEYTLSEPGDDGKVPVRLIISVEDTWNIIAVPYPKYDTNSGFELIIKARDYNFFGTMSAFRFDLGYKYDENSRNSIVFEIDTDIPFTFRGYNWNINFDHFFNYRPNVDEPYYYKNVTGLSVEVPFKKTVFTFGFEESFTLHEENADRYKAEYGEFQEGLYSSSEFYTSWEIPTGFHVGRYGEVTYTPKISNTFNHSFPEWPLDEFRLGPFMKFSHKLGFDRINWIGNFREGFDVLTENSYNLDFHRADNGGDILNTTYSIGGIGHFIISDSFGFSAYLRYRQWFYHDPAYEDSAGDALRGILDKAVHADYMLSLNLDFPVRLFRFTPSRWFGKPRLRLFDFELHFSPVIDLALYHDPSSDTSFNFKNMLVSGGAEIIIFPAFMRSLYLRASIAWNLREYINSPSGSYLPSGLPVIPKLPGGDNREIFIGIGHHY